MERVGSLEIDQDLAVERREWAAQRVGWVVILLILVAGLAGIWGVGPLSQATAASGGLTVHFERFARTRAESEMVVTLLHGSAVNGVAAIWLDRDYLESAAVQRVLPEPAGMAAMAGQVVYRFIVNESGQPVEVAFTVVPSGPGLARGSVGLVNGPEVSFSQVIYP